MTIQEQIDNRIVPKQSAENLPIDKYFPLPQSRKCLFPSDITQVEINYIKEMFGLWYALQEIKP
jgi:hypothetical protein